MDEAVVGVKEDEGREGQGGGGLGLGHGIGHRGYE